MIGGWPAHLEHLPAVGADPAVGVPIGSLVIRVDIPPLDCDRLCGPESLPFTGVPSELIVWGGGLLVGGAVLLACSVLSRHPIGRTRR